MKNKIIFLFMAVLFVFISVAYAHSGRTDSSGGHYNRQTGEYHYHHDYSAHNHEDGICPVDFIKKAGTDGVVYISHKNGDNIYVLTYEEYKNLNERMVF